MAIHEIHVSRKEGLGDPRGEEVARGAEALGFATEVIPTNIFRVDTDLESATLLADRVLADPITEIYVIDPETEEGGPPQIEVGYRQEVTDPLSGTIMQVAKDLEIPLNAARASVKYRFGGLSAEQAAQVAERNLVNTAVQEKITEKPESLVIKGERGQIEKFNIAAMTEEEFGKLESQMEFGFNLEERRSLQREARRSGREFTDIELKHIGSAWSEHCVHKTFNSPVRVGNIVKEPLFERIKRTSRLHFRDLVVTAFEDNAGGMNFYDGTVILIKGETQNRRSRVEPVAGAATGVGGILRDIIGVGQGGKVLLSCDIFGVASPRLKTANPPPDTLPEDSMLKGLVDGVRSYGNPMGIPTVNGSVHTHPDFIAKPTVMVIALGETKEEYAQKGKPQIGDRVVAIGGRTGRDGIGGATVSSIQSSEDTSTKHKNHVQIGNPIEEKKFADAILDARDQGLIRAVTDCGAAGFASAIGEMGSEIGVNVDISKALLKYEGLAPWEIWISESQERMVFAIEPSKVEQFRRVCDLHGVESTDLGEFDGSNKLKVRYEDEVVVDLDYDFIKNGLPILEIEADYYQELFEEPELDEPDDWVGTISRILAHDNVCSKLPIVEQYDTTVQGTNVLAPFAGVNFDAPNDAAVIRPHLNEPYGIVFAHGLNPILNRINPERGPKWAATEAVSNMVSAGGNFREMVLCVNYVSPIIDPQSMGVLDIEVDSVNTFVDAMESPVITGKDSLASSYVWPDGRRIDVPPVVNVAVAGKIPDVEKTTSTDFKREGSTIVLVGKMHPGMGGSTYFDINGFTGNDVPDVDLEVLPHVFDAVHNGIVDGSISACHDISEGGLITTLAEMSFGGGVGVEVDLGEIPEADIFLFNETAGRFVVEVKDPEEARRLFGNVPYMVLGKTTAENQISVRRGGGHLFSADVNELKNAWQAPMRALFG